MDTLAQDLSAHLKVDEEVEENYSDQECDENEEENDGDFSFIGDENDEESDDNDDFSFICDENSNVPLEMFPLFNTDLLLDNDERPPVKHVYLGMTSSQVVGDDVVSGPCCEWSKDKSSTSSEPGGCCKKSNSTGFSKLWRIKEFVQRSGSDGRDAFVFLNHATPTTMTSQKNRSDVKVTASTEDDQTQKTMYKNKKKKKSESVLAHERYMRSKAKDDERRRSYLPYRPELVGFFTNVNGGLTRNVHPY